MRGEGRVDRKEAPEIFLRKVYNIPRTTTLVTWPAQALAIVSQVQSAIRISLLFDSFSFASALLTFSSRFHLGQKSPLDPLYHLFIVSPLDRILQPFSRLARKRRLYQP